MSILSSLRLRAFRLLFVLIRVHLRPSVAYFLCPPRRMGHGRTQMHTD